MPIDFSTHRSFLMDANIGLINPVLHTRDKIQLTQALANRLTGRMQAGQDTLVFSGREISVLEPITFTNVDLYFVADSFFGQNNTVTITPLAAEPTPANQAVGTHGYNGRQITILAKSATEISVSQPGGAGSPGVVGDIGADATFHFEIGRAGRSLTVPGAIGGKGRTGGTGGVGGSLYLSTIELPTLGFINQPGGLGGDGGPGGKGGQARHLTARQDPDLGRGMWEFGPGTLEGEASRSQSGPIGDKGVNGNAGQTQQIKISKDEWLSQVAQLSNNWSEYRTRVGEYYYRAVNNPNLLTQPGLETATKISALALNELVTAYQLNPLNESAKILYNRILLLHTPLGVPRWVDIKPDYTAYEQAYLGYFPLVSQIQSIAQNYATNAVTESAVSNVLDAQANTVGSMQRTVAAELNAKIIPLQKQKQNDIDKRLAIDADLSAKIDARTKAMANHPMTIGTILTYVEVAVAVVSAVYTAGASLAAAAQGLMSLSSAGATMIDAFDTIESISDAKTAIGEYIDVSDGKVEAKDTSHQKLIEGAEDFVGAVKKFEVDATTIKKNVDIILNIDKAIRQIKGIKTDDPELDSLLAQKADNMHEVLLAKKDLELLGYDELVARQQISIYSEVAKQITGQKNAILQGRLNFLLEFAHAIKRSRAYMDFLIQSVFYGVRSLEIIQSADLSYLLRYDYGFVHPDIEANLDEFNDQEGAENLLFIYNESFSSFAGVTALRENFDAFVNHSWSPYTYKLDFDKLQLKDFLEDSQSAILRFTIDPRIELPNASGTVTNKQFVLLKSVIVSFVGVTTRNESGSFNANLYQSGSLLQNTSASDPILTVIEGRSAGINHVKTKKLTSNDLVPTQTLIDSNSSFNLNLRPFFSYYELSISPTEITSQGLNFTDLESIQIWFELIYKAN